MKISAYIYNLRKSLGITQREFGRLIQRDRSVVAKYETGKIIPPGDILLKIQDLNDYDKNN